MKIEDLNDFFKNLPKLDDEDREAFLADIKSIREDASIPKNKPDSVNDQKTL